VSASSMPPASRTSTSSSVASIVRSTRRALRWSSTIRIFMFVPAGVNRHVVAAGGQRGLVFADGDVGARDGDDEAGAALDPVGADAPAVGPDDALGDGQAQPCTSGLGGEPGREEVRGIGLEAG